VDVLQHSLAACRSEWTETRLSQFLCPGTTHREAHCAVCAVYSFFPQRSIGYFGGRTSPATLPDQPQLQRVVSVTRRQFSVLGFARGSLGSFSADSRIAPARAIAKRRESYYCRTPFCGVSSGVSSSGNSRRKGAWLGIPMNSQLIERAPLGISWQVLAGWFRGIKRPLLYH
jgi:hypothetical protein